MSKNFVEYTKAEHPINIEEEYEGDRGVITLIVKDYDGRPVKGAYVIEMHTGMTGITDEDGKVKMVKPPYNKSFPYGFPVWDVYFGGDFVTFYTYK